MKIEVEERRINVGGLTTRYFKAGNEGLPLVLLHGDSASALDWSWVLPKLGATQTVYAPDFPGFGDSAKPNREYSLEFLKQFLVDFMEALGIERAVVAGNSLGGQVALRFALSRPEQVAALVLVDSSGLGYSVTPLLTQFAIPLYGEAAITGCKTPPGAKMRSWLRATLFFAHPSRVPDVWIAEQERMAQMGGFLEATLSSLRAQLNVFGQYQVLLDSLGQLQMPTLVIWGTEDRVFPKEQAQDAVSRLKQGQLALIPDCGHLPHVERPELFSAELSKFLNQVVA
ncbi:MAG: alpha/beta fold hydrolase [Microcoleus vaginatus WJT46-NPBG5]|nr:alpha/beta fold hydrolase [Microcoleus vaginatus WJT46-NPBG5]